MKDIQNAKRLREIARMLERKLGILEENEVSCCGITMAQCHALIEIGRSERISLNELSQLLNLENSTMSRTVNNLVNSGLVQRDIDPKDRRYVTIELTDSGRTLFNDIEMGMEAYFGRICLNIPVKNRAQVLESMEIFLKAIDAADIRTQDIE